MKLFLALVFFAHSLYAQNVFESHYSAIGLSYSKTIDDIPVNHITFTRNTQSNYFIEAALNYVDEKESELNSAGLGFSKMLFKDENEIPVSGYTHLGIELIRIREIYYNLNFGFGLFHNFPVYSFSIVPEFFVNYNVMLNSNNDYSLLNPRFYINRNNKFVLGFFLNNTFKMTQWNSLIVSPGLVAVDKENFYKIKVAFNLDF